MSGKVGLDSSHPTHLDGVRVRRALGGVDKLISQALSNGLDVAEGRFTGLQGKA